MKLTEYKSDTQHYFRDEQGRRQGEYKDWYPNGQIWEVSHYRNGLRHGKYKSWYSNGHQWTVCHLRDGELHGEFKEWEGNYSGALIVHTFDMNGEEIVDFLKNPELYPSTPEEKTMFVLKYGSAPFIGDLIETT